MAASDTLCLSNFLLSQVNKPMDFPAFRLLPGTVIMTFIKTVLVLSFCISIFMVMLQRWTKGEIHGFVYEK